MDRPEMIQGLTNNHFKNISKWIQTAGLSLDLPHQRHQPGLNPAPPWNSMPFPWRRLRVGAAAAMLLATLQLGAPGFARVRRRKEPLEKELGVYSVLYGITYGI